jgi:hypothetical protein
MARIAAHQRFKFATSRNCEAKTHKMKLADAPAAPAAKAFSPILNSLLFPLAFAESDVEPDTARIASWHLL